MKVQIKNVWYNPAASAFEGRVDIRRGDEKFRYPCTVEGPMNMRPSDVMSQMRLQAVQMSDSAAAI